MLSVVTNTVTVANTVSSPSSLLPSSLVDVVVVGGVRSVGGVVNGVNVSSSLSPP